MINRRTFMAGAGGAMLCGSSQAQTPADTYAFINARWFDGARFASGAFFSIGGSLTFRRPTQVDVTVDLQGTYVVPAFAEAHNHNIEPRPDLSAVIRKYLTDGIFYVKVPNNPPRAKTALRERIDTKSSIDVAFSNGGLTATGGHPMALAKRNLERSGRLEDWGEGAFYHTIDTPEDLERKWPRVLAGRPDFIKAYLQYSEEYDRRKDNAEYFERSALDPRILPRIVERAHDAGLRVSCHIETAADFHHALIAGVDEINHLPGLKPERGDWRNVEIERYRITKNDAALAARNGTVVITTFATALARILQANEGEAFVEWRELLISNLTTLKSAGAAIAIGSDRYGDTAVVEAQGLHTLSVFTNLELLRMWCDTSAQTIFPERRIGRLREGFEASFLVLTANPLEDFTAVRSIQRRFKQGAFLDI